MSNLTDCSKLDIPAIVGPAQVGQSLELSQYDFLQICHDDHAICNFADIFPTHFWVLLCNLCPIGLKGRSEAISDKKAPSEPVKVPLGPNKAPLSKPRLPSNLGWLLGSQQMLLKILISSLRPSWLGSWFSEIMHFRQGLV